MSTWPINNVIFCHYDRLGGRTCQDVVEQTCPPVYRPEGKHGTWVDPRICSCSPRKGGRKARFTCCIVSTVFQKWCHCILQEQEAGASNANYIPLDRYELRRATWQPFSGTGLHALWSLNC